MPRLLSASIDVSTIIMVTASMVALIDAITYKHIHTWNTVVRAIDDVEFYAVQVMQGGVVIGIARPPHGGVSVVSMNARRP